MVESALRVDAKDPLAVLVKPEYTAAHDRVANAWRGALRERDMPQRFEPATPDEIAMLQKLYPAPQRHEGESEIDYEIRRFCIRETDGTAVNDRHIRPLMANGFIEFGIRREIIMWSSSGENHIYDMPRRMMRITMRGIRAIIGAEHQTVGGP